MNAKRMTAARLNQLRQEAVRLRLEKKTLKDIQQLTGLTAPTIIDAYKCFVGGGWAAINTAERGSPAGLKASKATGALDESSLADLLKITYPDAAGARLWTINALTEWLINTQGTKITKKTAARYAHHWGFNPPNPLQPTAEGSLRGRVSELFPGLLGRPNTQILIGGISPISPNDPNRFRKSGFLIHARDLRGKIHWLSAEEGIHIELIMDFLGRLCDTYSDNIALLFKSWNLNQHEGLQQWLKKRHAKIQLIPISQADADEAAVPSKPQAAAAAPGISYLPSTISRNAMSLTHLQRLEAESMQIMREVVAETENPVMLYSIGKDSAVMLHLAMKAFFPSTPPFPLLHVDTTWKFREMYKFRDEIVAKLGMKLIVHINEEGVAKGINPFTHGSAIHTDIMKTEGLKQALNKYQFDAAFGGARRDEEKSRAKERIFSFRTSQHRWDPKNQRPELWKLYNTRKHPKESIRVFPLSNWTELDIWQYIHLENIPIVPLYYSAERPVVERDGTLIMVDDERMPLNPGEVPVLRKVRFRTLGCYPLTGAVESEADTLPAIIQEMLLTKTSERQGRMIDHDSSASMEKKKQEGYF